MQFNEILKLISDENRMKIIEILRQGEACVCDLSEKLGIEQSLLSHHLAKLKSADLVLERKVARWVHYSLNKSAFANLENQFKKTFGSGEILDKKCEIHSECCANCK